MKALIIGGNRFFGKRLVTLLLKKGVEVTLFNRGQAKDDFGETVKRIILDRTKLSSDHPFLTNKKWDIIYDQVCYDGHEAQGACDTFQGKTSRYIFTSTKSVYNVGRSIKEESFDSTNHSFNKLVDRNEDYGEAKR
jgi:hypothetical protein